MANKNFAHFAARDGATLLNFAYGLTISTGEYCLNSFIKIDPVEINWHKNLPPIRYAKLNYFQGTESSTRNAEKPVLAKRCF